MRKLLVVALVGALAAPALADITATAMPLGSSSFSREWTCEPVYSNMDYAGGYSGIDAAYDDYDSILEDGDIELCKLRFVGGIAAVGDTLYFDFFYPDTTWANGFYVDLPSAGASIWTIGLGDCPTGFFVPEAGLMQISTDAPAGFIWYYENTSAELGTEDIALYGPDAETSWTFELQNCVPEPATLSLLVLGGLALIRRR